MNEIKNLLKYRAFDAISLLVNPPKGLFMLEAKKEWFMYSSIELRNYKPPERKVDYEMFNNLKGARQDTEEDEISEDKNPLAAFIDYAKFQRQVNNT